MEAPASEPFAKPCGRIYSFRILPTRPKEAYEFIERNIRNVGFQRTEIWLLPVDPEQSRLFNNLRSVIAGQFLFVEPVGDRAASLNSRALAGEGEGFTRY